VSATRATGATTPRRPTDSRRPARPIRSPLAVLLAFESATLAVFSTLHLTGILRVGSRGSDGAGFAEALICLALAAGAWALARSPGRGRRVALYTVAFAIGASSSGSPSPYGAGTRSI